MLVFLPAGFGFAYYTHTLHIKLDESAVQTSRSLPLCAVARTQHFHWKRGTRWLVCWSRVRRSAD